MLGGSTAIEAMTNGAGSPTTNGGLIAVGPGATDGDLADIDLDTAEPRDLIAESPIGPLGSTALAAARELLDAAEAWHGRPQVPV